MPLPPVVDEPLRRVADRWRSVRRLLGYLSPDPAVDALKRKKKELERDAGKNPKK